MPTLVLAQISDLHFSSRILNERFINPIAGMHGHDKVLAFGLVSALEDLPADFNVPRDAFVIASGDLTRGGSDSEFATAHTILMSKARLQLVDPHDTLGCEIPADNFASVPGNHDQFAGLWMITPAFNPALAGVHFEVTPWHRTLTEGNLTLDLFGIDTNGGLLPPVFNYPAWGSVAKDELNELDQMLTALPARQGPSVRALVMHHSLSFLGGTLGSWISAASLDIVSRMRILRLCAKHRIAAVLTGHTHDRKCRRFPVGGGWSVRELRSPSTLIGPRSPGAQPVSAKSPNGFLAHELTSMPNGNTRWDAWSYNWSSGRFLREPNAAMSFVI